MGTNGGVDTPSPRGRCPNRRGRRPPQGGRRPIWAVFAVLFLMAFYPQMAWGAWGWDGWTAAGPDSADSPGAPAAATVIVPEFAAPPPPLAVPREVFRPLAIGKPTQCNVAIAGAARRYGIPTHVLEAVGLVEAGQAGAIWPWTADIDGDGHYFRTRKQAISAVSNALKNGVFNVDVGCLQVNLHWHPHAFASVAAAFNPTINADYGAAYLKALKIHYGSWTQAVQFYHSSSWEQQRTYLCAVLRRYRRLSGRGTADIRRWCAAP